MTGQLEILIVDDSRVSRLMSAAYIRALRPTANIREAEHGDAALALLAAAPADVAILDMNMPRMTGLELAELIKPLAPATRMALLTANVQTAVRQRAESMGMRFFRKPITEQVIAEILGELCPEP